MNRIITEGMIGGGTQMRNEIQFRVDAEYLLRARLLEAENYHMLNKLRKRCPHGIILGWHEMTHRLGGSLVYVREKLEAFETSLATWFEYEGRVG